MTLPAVLLTSAFGAPRSAFGNRYLFQGREYSYATGLYHFRHRWYDPETGRWLSNDPIGISGGMNQYVFCGSDPIGLVDPLGLCEDEPVWEDIPSDPLDEVAQRLFEPVDNVLRNLRNGIGWVADQARRPFEEIDDDQPRKTPEWTRGKDPHTFDELIDMAMFIGGMRSGPMNGRPGIKGQGRELTNAARKQTRWKDYGGARFRDGRHAPKKHTPKGDHQKHRKK